MLTTRPAEPADFAAIARIFHQAVRQTARQDYTEAQVQGWSPEEWPPEKWQERTASLEVRVAVIGERVVGFIGFAPSGYVDLLFTDPAFIRQGVARRLLKEAEAGLRKAGVRTTTTEASLTARPFFEAMGYTTFQAQTVTCHDVPLRNFRMGKALEVPRKKPKKRRMAPQQS